jgi:hypothetical protein
MSAPCDTELGCTELECNETMCKNDLYPVQNDDVWEALFEEWRRKKEPSSAMNERILRMVELYKNGDPCSDSEIDDTDHLDCMCDEPELPLGNEIAEGFSDFYGGSL